MGEDDYCMEGIHPPNVVLVNSTQTSPDHHPTQELCSPLSTAPNSPYRVSYEEDEDEDDDDNIIEVRPEEIQELLDTPVSSKRRILKGEIPFDEGGNTPKSTQQQEQQTPKRTIDPLLGNRRLQQENEDPAIVSPMNTSIHEDIDAYEEEEEDDRGTHKSDEKKEESVTPPPVYPPSYPGYNSSSKKLTESYPRVVPPTTSEDDSVPHDERQFPTSSSADSSRDFIESVRNNADHNEDQSPMKEALQSAEREVQEMERRVQEMIEKRRSSLGSSSQPRTGVEEEPNKTQSEPESIPYEMEGEPPSLSPRRDVHSSLDSGGSSYYYDGSALGSSATDDPNNTTLESITSSAIGGTTRVDMSIHPPLVAPSSSSKVGSKDYYSRLTESSRSASAMESSREETSSTDKPRVKLKKTATESFASSTNGSFADIVEGTSRALHQVTDDLANFLILPSSEPSSKRKSKRSKKPPTDQWPPISPSQESDVTPDMDRNLSPRRPTNDVDMDLLYRQKPSANVAKARSLVSGRHTKSPNTAPYLQGNNSNNSNNSNNHRGTDDPKQRARQVMNKRERERPSASKAKRSSERRGSKRSSEKQASEQPMNIPVPPTLYRIAAMMEGLGGGSAEDDAVLDDTHSSESDWPSSVSQFVEEYQTAITESLRNLSMDEVSGLAAQKGEKARIEAEFGNDYMVSPGVAVSSPSKDIPTNEINKFSNLDDKEYDALMQEMTFGSCLQMPTLDHPPIMTTRNSSTAKPTSNAKDYGRGIAGVLQYDAGLDYQEFQYHSHYDGQQQLDPAGDEMSEHDERAAFARQLSERLMDLDPNSPMKSESPKDKFSSPQKLDTINGSSFDSRDSSFMSPPKRGANKDGMIGADGSMPQQGGLFVSNMPRSGDLPYSGQPSVSSEGNSNSILATPDGPGRKRNSRPRGKDAKDSPAPSSGNVGETLSDMKPTMVQSIDNEIGIAKGDVMLSLLCDNSFQASEENPDSWAWRVKEAIWRGRSMRKDCSDIALSRSNSQDEGDNMRSSRRSLPVDVDDVRVVGGINNVSSIQEKALAHLERDEFEQALELYEDIIFNYYSFFEQVLAKRDEFSSEDVSMELSNFKPYIGASLHNLGVIHLLKGDYEDAYSFFKRAVDNRRSCLGEIHPDCVTSLVRLATCRFAMDNFADAHTNLELSLALAGSKARTTNDYSQLGEILNNLGCLSYMCGQPTKAMKLFRESLDVQLAVLNSTLYGGPKYSAHTATLNLSVTRGNIGFLALVLRDVSSGILALEAALREQRLLLAGAHVTLVSTMDHLAVANLLDGRTQKAIKMLRRIYELLKAAYGPNDARCLATRRKIMTIRGQQITKQQQEQQESPPRSAAKQQQQQQRRYEEETKAPERQQHQAPVDGRQVGSSRVPANPNNGGNINGNAGGVGGGGGGGKVGSVFKAIRSLGRKKN